MNDRLVRKLQLAFNGALICAAMLTVSQVQAQSQSGPPADMASKGTDPRIEPVSNAHGLSRDEARRQLALTDSFEQQIAGLRERFSDSYLKSIFSYGRAFDITLVFDRDVELAAVQQALPNDLRPVVKIRRSRLGRQEIMDTKARILSQLASHFEGVGASFDYATDRFTVYLPDDADEQNAITRLDPSIRPFVTIKRGASRSLAGAATEADDPTHPDKFSIWGGWPVWLNGSPRCTANFIGHDTLSKGFVMLTAGHCDDTNVQLRWKSDGTFKIMQDAFYQSIGGSYDMQAHWGAFLGSDGYFWVDNDVSGTYKYNCDVNGANCRSGTYRNLYSGVNSTGYVAVINAYKGTSWSSYGYNDNHPVNAWRCKYGMRTGITCGPIVDSEYSFVSTDGVQLNNFVRMKIDAATQAAAMVGDSGGPVFWITNSVSTFPEAFAAGIVSAANVKFTGQLNVYRPCVPALDGDCYVDYMPIDRINDVHPLALEAAGAVAPIEVN